jgi:hypothetical protein
MSTPTLRAILPGLLLILATLTHAQPYGCHYHDHDFRLEDPDPVTLAQLRSWAARSDSVDILHYDIWLEVPSSGSVIKARTTVLFTPKLEGLDTLTFDLAKLSVDSVVMNGQLLDFSHPEPYLFVTLPESIPPGDTAALTFHYRGTPLRDPIWGGFYFEGGYAYNLGIGISSNPPNFGRVWYPCFDNFVERATYDIRILSFAGRRGYAIGDLISEELIGQDSVVRHYRMDQRLPTYLTNVAVSDYQVHRDTHYSAYGPVPIELIGRPSHFNNMVKAFGRLGEAIDAIEHWYGPYPWSRVGYVMTTAGAMEHPTNTAFPVNALNNGLGDVRLMTHELGHHWWGNITTLSAPTDMWIKEGNAEYCAHLLDEWSDGRAAFLTTVKSNHQVVLTQVHQQDGGFLPLSGIPFANIYGRHTYLKGASVLHNMRGYLGDSLFRAGQLSVLENHAYAAIDAATYRDHLAQATGVDMGPFFDAWLYHPGFASFVIQDWQAVSLDSQTQVTIALRQGLRAAPEYHQAVPLEISFYDKDWQVFRATVLAGDEYSQHMVTVPFEPVHIALNEGGQLNQARLDHQRVISSPGNYVYPFVRFRVNATGVTDSALVRVDHQWVAPDPLEDQPDLRISGTNFWVVSGIFPENLVAQGRILYDATGGNAFLDADIAGVNEDSLVLLFRPSPMFPWQEHPDYNVIKLIPTDGRGDVIINGLKPGEYALARGAFLQVSTKEPDLRSAVKVYPNPSRGPVFLQWPEGWSLPRQVRWVDNLGREVHRQVLAPQPGLQILEAPSVPGGLYHLLLDTDGGTLVHKTLLRF